MGKEKKTTERLKIMVSSTVYGIEAILDQVYGLLSGFGYNVWMSHMGTVPVQPNITALESCLVAVDACDVFFSIITPRYGSGVVGDDLGVTHQELLKALELNKPRWMLARKLQQAEHESVLVNPDISHVFYLNELMERVGRGTYKIVQECKEFRMRGPKWQNTATGVRLTFYAATSPVVPAAELNDRQVQIKQFAAEFATDVSERQARRDLAELATLGFLKRVGSGPSSAFKRTGKKLN